MEKILLHDGAFCAQILPYGATLHALCVPDRDGTARDVVLGYDNLANYQRHDGYLGATVGRNANRIAGAQFVLDDQMWQLSANEGKISCTAAFQACIKRCGTMPKRQKTLSHSTPFLPTEKTDFPVLWRFG